MEEKNSSRDEISNPTEVRSEPKKALELESMLEAVIEPQKTNLDENLTQEVDHDIKRDEELDKVLNLKSSETSTDMTNKINDEVTRNIVEKDQHVGGGSDALNLSEISNIRINETLGSDLSFSVSLKDSSDANPTPQENSSTASKGAETNTNTNTGSTELQPLNEAEAVAVAQESSSTNVEALDRDLQSKETSLEDDDSKPPIRELVVTKTKLDAEFNKDSDNLSVGMGSRASSKKSSKSKQYSVRRKRGTKKQNTNKASFTADSPYYSAYVDKEIQSLSLLSSTLKDLCSKARTFGECGAAMAEATRKLSISCKLDEPSPNYTPNRTGDFEQDQLEKRREKKFQKDRRESVGHEMATSLKLLGDVSKLLGKTFHYNFIFKNMIANISTNLYLYFYLFSLPGS